MTDKKYQELPPLPPLGEVMKLVLQEKVQRQEKRTLTAQELVTQLRQHFPPADLGKLVDALGEGIEFERTTNCPILQDQYKNGKEKYSGEIRIIKTSKENEVICPYFFKEGHNDKKNWPYELPRNGCAARCKGVCGYASAKIF